jgi:predicted metal-dependent enzyme (double-stranded beta helix superfamily)
MSSEFSALPALLRSLDLVDGGARSARRPTREDVRTVQHALSDFLADETFYLDCVERELAAVCRRTPDNPSPPLFLLRDRGMSVRMFYWWPGKIAPPHEHTAWTVTAVFHGALEVTTYDFDIARREQRLERKHTFAATRGRAGHIYDRCIHSPANRTAQISTSLHIFNASDEAQLEAEVGEIEGMASPMGARVAGPVFDEITQLQLCVLAQIALQFRSDRALRLLGAIGAAGDAQTRAMAELACWKVKLQRRQTNHEGDM